MARWLAAGVLLLGVVGTIPAKPPAEPVVQGKERSPIERDLFLPEPTAARETVPQIPPSQDEIVSALRTFLSIQLGTVPLVPRVMW